MAWFRKEKRDEEGFVSLGVSAESVAEGQLTPINVSKTDVLLTRCEGEIVAFARECPHAAADLLDGSVHRGRVSCPDHGWKFDIRTGRTLWPEDEACRLKRFAVKMTDDELWVLVE